VLASRTLTVVRSVLRLTSTTSDFEHDDAVGVGVTVALGLTLEGGSADAAPANPKTPNAEPAISDAPATVARPTNLFGVDTSEREALARDVLVREVIARACRARLLIVVI